jgi:YbbR domain-containing protein
MLTRLRNNFAYKMFALVCAIGLHYIALSEQNPTGTRSFTLRPVPRGVTSGALVDSASIPPVTVTVTGPADDVNRMTQEDVNAAIELGGIAIGPTPQLPVKVELALNARGQVDIADYSPRTASLVLKPRKTRRLAVTVDYPKTLPPGYAYQVPVVSPRQATVSGAEDAVNLVAQLLVEVDSESSLGPIDDDYAIRALDAHGNVVSDVALTPAMVHVQIGVVKAPVVKALLVSPTIVGGPPFAYTVASVTPDPPTVTVAGKPEVLARVGTIATEPIDITGLTADQARPAACVAPAGLTVTAPQSVTVKIHIVPRGVAAPRSTAPIVTVPTEPAGR